MDINGVFQAIKDREVAQGDIKLSAKVLAGILRIDNVSLFNSAMLSLGFVPDKSIGNGIPTQWVYSVSYKAE